MTKADLRKLVVESVVGVLTEGILDNMMKGAKPAQLPPHLYEKLLGMGNLLAGGFQDQVSDDVKIVAAIMYYSSGNKETNIFDTVTSFQQKGIKENTKMKRSELKGLIKEVVRQCLKEAGPQYKVRDGRSYVEKTGEVNRAREIQEDPAVNEASFEKTVKGIKKSGSDVNPWAVAQSMHNKGMDVGPRKESIVRKAYKNMSENGEELGGDQPYDEQEEINLIKAVAKDVLELLKMHKGMDTGEEGESEETGESEEKPPFPPKAAPKAPKAKKEKEDGELDEGGPQYKTTAKRSQIEVPGKVDRAKKMQDTPEVCENHKVQHRSYKTVNDVDQDPKNVRDPEVPQA